MAKHYKSVFENEQELLKAILSIHTKQETFDIDPMFFKGKFYKDGLSMPKYKYDLNPQDIFVERCNAESLDLDSESLDSYILDPPFLIGNRPSQKKYYSAKTHTMYKDFDTLKISYKGILKEAYRILKNKGILVFKCQDYTDSKTTMTHVHVHNWATELGFYAKDLAILVKPNKVYNGGTNQRHFRKIHTYFWVFEKKKIGGNKLNYR